MATNVFDDSGVDVWDEAFGGVFFGEIIDVPDHIFFTSETMSKPSVISESMLKPSVTAESLSHNDS